MAERDVRRMRRVVRHAAVPRSTDTAAGANGSTPATTPIPAPGSPPASEWVPPRRAFIAHPTVAPTLSVARTAPEPAAEAEREAEPALRPLGELRRPQLPSGFPTRDTLATQDAAAEDLHRQLAALRRQLDQEPPPLSPARKRNRKPLLGVLVVGGAAGLFATATLVPWSNLDLPGQDGKAATPSAAAPAKAAPAKAVPAKIAPVTALAPLDAPAGSLPAAGPGVTTPGTMMVVQIGPDGALDVVEHAVLGPRGMRGLTLSLPSMSSLGGSVATLNPSVRNLRVAVNGTATQATPTADGTGWTVADAGQRARTVQLSYRIIGAVVLSRPSDAGRALAVSLPLLGQTLREQGLPLVVRAVGPQVGGVSCPGAPTAQMLCGMQAGNGWTASVPATATSPLLLLQLNLKA